MRLPILVLAAATLAPSQTPAPELTVAGTRFLMNGRHFPWTGVSFFNAIYNPAFHKSGEERRRWLER